MSCSSCSEPRAATPSLPSAPPPLVGPSLVSVLLPPQLPLPPAPFCTMPTAVPGAFPLAPLPSCYTPSASHSGTPSDGARLEGRWMNAAPVDSMVLLGRVGDILGTFSGTGFISVKNGIASLNSTVPLSTVYFWPDLVSQTSMPVSPKPFPYLVVGDSEGKSFLLVGKMAEDSIPVWRSTTRQWELTSFAAFPICSKGRIPKSTAIQVIGFEPYGLTDENVVKCAKALCGEGLIMLQKRATNVTDPECDCEACEDPDRDVECVATVLPFPPMDGQAYGIKYNELSGTFGWVAVTAVVT